MWRLVDVCEWRPLLTTGGCCLRIAFNGYYRGLLFVNGVQFHHRILFVNGVWCLLQSTLFVNGANCLLQRTDVCEWRPVFTALSLLRTWLCHVSRRWVSWSSRTFNVYDFQLSKMVNFALWSFWMLYSILKDDKKAIQIKLRDKKDFDKV